MVFQYVLMPFGPSLVTGLESEKLLLFFFLFGFALLGSLSDKSIGNFPLRTSMTHSSMKVSKVAIKST
jgi:hypothetical protein